MSWGLRLQQALAYKMFLWDLAGFKEAATASEINTSTEAPVVEQQVEQLPMVEASHRSVSLSPGCFAFNSTPC